jgi:hypothetical protein
VPGFISKWKHRRNEEGLTVSQVEPIQDPHIQEQVRTLIDKREMVHQFRFQQGIGFVRLLARSRKQRRKNHGKALAKAL